MPGEAFEGTVTGGPVEVQWRTWDMRDNWMSHPNFSPGEVTFEISHTMLVERLQYLPGNQIEGNQTVMARAILGDDASTNLVAHVFVLGSDPVPEKGSEGSMMGVAVVGLSFAVVLLVILLVLATMRLREDAEWVDDELDDEAQGQQ